MNRLLMIIVPFILLISNLFSQTTIELVKDLNPNGDSNPSNFIGYKNNLFFNVDYYELLVTDGTIGGTNNLSKNRLSRAYIGTGSSIVWNDKLYFLGHGLNNGDFGLWITDGTSDGTNLEFDFDAVDSIRILGELNNKLFFVGSHDTYGWEIWVVDNSFSGIELLRDINLGISNADVYGMTKYNDKVYFSANNGIHGEELWVTDGTTAGTVLVKDINPEGNSSPWGFTQFEEKLYFHANDSIHGNEMWVTDGTTTGTLLVKNINPNGDSNPRYFTQFKDKLYFTAETQESNRELYESDGTTEGTRMIQPDIAPKTNPCGRTYELYVHKDALYFAANFSTNGNELYKLTSTELTLNKTMPIVQYKIHPNPVESYLRIEVDKNTDFTLYNLLGRAVKSFRIANNGEIYLGDLSSGIYILKDMQSFASFKFIKQ